MKLRSYQVIGITIIIASTCLVKSGFCASGWTELDAPNSPHGRSGASAVVLPTKEDYQPELVIFGGSLGTCPTSPTVNAVVSVNVGSVNGSATWGSHDVAEPSTAPSPRVYSQATRAANERTSDGTFGNSVFVYGGNTATGPDGGSWLLSLASDDPDAEATWTSAPLRPGGSSGAGTPGPRAGHALVPVEAADPDWSPVQGTKGPFSILFGGFNGTAALADAWMLDLGTRKAHLLNDGNPPPGYPKQPGPSVQPAAAVVPQIGRGQGGGPAGESHPALVVFGGQDPEGVVSQELWMYSLGEFMWANLTGGVTPDPDMGAPKGRVGASLRVAGHGGKRFGNDTALLLFGGADAQGRVFEDTWLLHVPGSMPAAAAAWDRGLGVRWEHVSGATAPGASSGSSAVDAPSARAYSSAATVWSGAGASSPEGVASGVLLYGGVDVQPDIYKFDTWFFQA